MFRVVLTLVALSGCSHISAAIRASRPMEPPPPTREEARLVAENDITLVARDLSMDLAEEYTRANRLHIALYSLQATNPSAERFARLIADELAVQLVKARVGFVERLQTVLKEGDALRVGGADTVAIGSVTDFGDQIRVTLRLVDSSTGEGIGSAARTLMKTDRLRVAAGELQPSALRRQSEHHPITSVLTPPEWAKKQGVIEVVNQSQWCVRPWLNDHIIRVYDEKGEMSCLPAGRSVFLRLQETGPQLFVASASNDDDIFHHDSAFELGFYLRTVDQPFQIVMRTEHFYSLR